MLKLEKEHIKPASLMMARAFKDDPFDAYVYPNPKDREKKVPYESQFIFRYHLSYGNCFITSPKIEGVAIWVHSDNLRMSFWRMCTTGAIWPAKRLGLIAGIRMQRTFQYVEKKHKELMSNKHWYLMILGVDPGQQGKGYASDLLNGMLSRIDEEGLPCYLETWGERNISMYGHFGFKIIEEFLVPKVNVNLTAMLREPKQVEKGNK